MPVLAIVLLVLLEFLNILHQLFEDGATTFLVEAWIVSEVQ